MRSSTRCSRIEPPRPLNRHRRDPHGSLRADLLLRAERRRSGLHPEDLLRARADGDRGALRLRGGRDLRHPAPAHARLQVGPALVRLHPPVPDPRRRRADHRLDLGAGLVGPLVGVGRADARVVFDRLPALRLLPAVALLDRGPPAPGALRERLRRHRRSLRAAELPGRASRAGLFAPARVRDGQRRAASEDATHVLGSHHRDGPDVRHALALRDGGQAHARPRPRAQTPARRRGDAPERPQRGADRLMPALPLDEAGKYVAAAYLVFLALILIYVAIMATRLSHLQRDIEELAELAEERDREKVGTP